MNKTYKLLTNGAFWYPGGYEKQYNINISSEEKKFIEFMDEKIDELIREYNKK